MAMISFKKAIICGLTNQVEGKCIFSSNLLRPLGVQNKVKDVYICTALQILLMFAT